MAAKNPLRAQCSSYKRPIAKGSCLNALMERGRKLPLAVWQPDGSIRKMERRAYSPEIQPTPSRDLWRNSGRRFHIVKAGRLVDSHVVVGALSSMASAVSVAAILHPLDVVKTIKIREGSAAFEALQKERTHSRWPGIRSWKAVHSLVHQRGVKAAWSGIGLSTCATALSWGIFRSVYDTIRRQNIQGFPQGYTKNAIAGSAASAITIFLTHPLFNAKSDVALHALENKRGEDKEEGRRALTGIFGRPMLFRPVIDIYSSGGLRALYRGLDTMLLGIPNNTIQMVLYERMKQLVPIEAPRARSALGKSFQRLPVTFQTTFKHAVWSVASKACATGITYPLHVIRLYQQHPPAEIEAVGPWTMAKHIVSHEGAAALYRGFGIHFQKSLLQNALVFVLFEKLQDSWMTTKQLKLPRDDGNSIRLSAPPSMDLKYLMRRISTIPQDQRWESGKPFTVLRRTGSIATSLSTVRRRPSSQETTL